MSTASLTATTTHDDGSFVRTALVAIPGGDSGSVAIVNPEGKRFALVNVFLYEDGTLIVDVIDTDEQYEKRRALVFNDGQRQSLPAGKVISADFRTLKESA